MTSANDETIREPSGSLFSLLMKHIKLITMEYKITQIQHIGRATIEISYRPLKIKALNLYGTERVASIFIGNEVGVATLNNVAWSAGIKDGETYDLGALVGRTITVAL